MSRCNKILEAQKRLDKPKLMEYILPHLPTSHILPHCLQTRSLMSNIAGTDISGGMMPTLICIPKSSLIRKTILITCRRQHSPPCERAVEEVWSRMRVKHSAVAPTVWNVGILARKENWFWRKNAILYLVQEVPAKSASPSNYLKYNAMLL